MPLKNLIWMMSSRTLRLCDLNCGFHRFFSQPRNIRLIFISHTCPCLIEKWAIITIILLKFYSQRNLLLTYVLRHVTLRDRLIINNIIQIQDDFKSKSHHFNEHLLVFKEENNFKDKKNIQQFQHMAPYRLFYYILVSHIYVTLKTMSRHYAIQFHMS